jgi:hypothetical protein
MCEIAYSVNRAPQTYAGESDSGFPTDPGALPMGPDDSPTFIGKISESQIPVSPLAQVLILFAGHQQPFTLRATEPGHFQHLILRSAVSLLPSTYFNEPPTKKVPGSRAKAAPKESLERCGMPPHCNPGHSARRVPKRRTNAALQGAGGARRFHAPPGGLRAKGLLLRRI